MTFMLLSLIGYNSTNSPRNEEHLIALFIIEMYILYTAQFQRHKLRHYRVMETLLVYTHSVILVFQAILLVRYLGVIEHYPLPAE